MGEKFRAGAHPFLHGNRGVSVHMPHVQTHPQPGVVHLPENLSHHLRLLLQHVFQHDVHAGVFLQKILPENNGLLRIPAGVVQSFVEAPMNDDLPGIIPPRQRDCLPVAERRQLPCFRVNGTGEQLAEWRVQQSPSHACKFLGHSSVGRLELLIHIPRGAVFRDFQPQAVPPGFLRGVRGNGGKKQLVFFHASFLPSSSRIPYFVLIRSSFSSRGFPRTRSTIAVATACLIFTGNP